jgi:lipid A 3-O-deacylase
MAPRNLETSSLKWNLIGRLVLLPFFVVLFSGHAQGDPLVDQVALGVGRGRTDIDIYRIGLIHNFDRKLLNNNYGWLGMYAEASINYWKHDEDDIVAGAISPVFIYYFGDSTNLLLPYIEGGIGASILSDTMLYDRDMATLFQFEDRIGIGIKSKNIDLSFRFMHYSNASIKAPNRGIDIFIFTGSYIF